MRKWGACLEKNKMVRGLVSGDRRGNVGFTIHCGYTRIHSFFFFCLKWIRRKTLSFPLFQRDERTSEYPSQQSCDRPPDYLIVCSSLRGGATAGCWLIFDTWNCTMNLRLRSEYPHVLQAAYIYLLFFGRKGAIHFGVWSCVVQSRVLAPGVSLSCRCAATYTGHKVACPPKWNTNDLTVMEFVYNTEITDHEGYVLWQLVAPALNRTRIWTVLVSPKAWTDWSCSQVRVYSTSCCSYPSPVQNRLTGYCIIKYMCVMKGL